MKPVTEDKTSEDKPAEEPIKETSSSDEPVAKDEKEPEEKMEVDSKIETSTAQVPTEVPSEKSNEKVPECTDKPEPESTPIVEEKIEQPQIVVEPSAEHAQTNNTDSLPAVPIEENNTHSIENDNVTDIEKKNDIEKPAETKLDIESNKNETPACK